MENGDAWGFHLHLVQEYFKNSIALFKYLCYNLHDEFNAFRVFDKPFSHSILQCRDKPADAETSNKLIRE